MRTRRAIMIATTAIWAVVGSVTGDEVVRARMSPLEDASLDDNYTVKLHGKYAESAPVDLVLTGSGSRFSINLAEQDLSFSGTLQPDNGRVRIDYKFSVGALIPRGPRVSGLSSNGVERVVPSFEFRQYGVTGSAVLSLGKPLTIVSVNQNKLELTVTKFTEDASPGK